MPVSRTESDLTLLNRFLFDLYRIAYASSIEQFHGQVFQFLEQMIHCNSGWWGMTTGADQRSFIAKASLYKLPKEFVTEYAELIDQDVLIDNLEEREGITVVFNGEIPGECAAMAEFDRKYQLHSCLTTIQTDPATGAVSFLSVFRNQKQPPFNEDERMLMQLAMPHILQAWAQNLRLAIANIHPGSISDTCFITADGKILDASPGFVTDLYREFPQWQGANLDADLLDLLLATQPGSYRGKSIDIWRVSAPGVNPIKIQSGHMQSSALTPREAAVAAAFATGRSYKEIALSLALSPATVRSYLQQCYSKLEVTNKVELGRALTGKA